MLKQPILLLPSAVQNRYPIKQNTQLRIFLVYGLFIDAVGSSSYMASNDRTSKGTRHTGGVEAWLRSFLTSTLDGSLLLLLRWHYSTMRTFPSIMDFSQSALVFDLSFQFVILHLLIISVLYTIPPTIQKCSWAGIAQSV